jgi:hypothetical protein
MLLNQFFVSYAHANAAPVASTVGALRAGGCQVWHDETGIAEGENIVRRLEHGLGTSRYVVLFASGDYFERPWTRAEYEAAIYATVNDSSRRVFVVDLGENAAFPAFVAGLRRIVFTSGEEVARRLIAAVNGPSSATPAASPLAAQAESTAPELKVQSIDWSTAPDTYVLACADALWTRRHDIAASKQTTVSIVVDIGAGAALNLGIVRSMIANPMMMVHLQGEIGLYQKAVKVTGRYKAALTGDMGRDVATQLSVDDSTERAEQALGKLREICRSLSRSATYVSAT